MNLGFSAERIYLCLVHIHQSQKSILTKTLGKSPGGDAKTGKYERCFQGEMEKRRLKELHSIIFEKM